MSRPATGRPATYGTDEIVAFLAKQPLFAGLDEAALREVARHALPRRIGRGEQILVQGEPAPAAYLVVHGQVRVLRLSPTGREQTLMDLSSGQAFNLVPVFDGGPAPSSVVARTAGLILSIPAADFVALMQRYPALGEAALRDMSRRLRHLTALVESLSLYTVSERLARLLLEMARQPDKEPARFTQQELATRLGTVREVVSRTLRQFEKDGLISIQRHRIVVLDPEALEAVCPE